MEAGVVRPGGAGTTPLRHATPHGSCLGGDLRIVTCPRPRQDEFQPAFLDRDISSAMLSGAIDALQGNFREKKEPKAVAEALT
mgnify:CR=1 FL=1